MVPNSKEKTQVVHIKENKKTGFVLFIVANTTDTNYKQVTHSDAIF